MAERELVTECNDDGKWQLTQLGSLLVEGLQYALEMAELVVLLRDIPYSEIEVDLEHLQDSKRRMLLENDHRDRLIGFSNSFKMGIMFVHSPQ